MSEKEQDHSALQNEAAKFEMIEGLQRAIDRNYRRLLDAARADWERLFTGKDPSDACVSVRINSTAVESSASTKLRAGYLPRGAETPSGKARPRLA